MTSSLSRTELPHFHSVQSVAARLGVSVKSVRRWINRGELEAHKFGRQIRIAEPDLAAFIRDHRQL